LAQFHFEIVTPERLVRSEDAYMVTVPGSEGDMGILAGHAPVMSSLRDGVVRIYATDGATPTEVAVSGGFVEVNEKGLTILAESVTA
jgi:F-type H+-transporting ATPase subunit epsilon